MSKSEFCLRIGLRTPSPPGVVPDDDDDEPASPPSRSPSLPLRSRIVLLPPPSPLPSAPPEPRSLPPLPPPPAELSRRILERRRVDRRCHHSLEGEDLTSADVRSWLPGGSNELYSDASLLAS